jgi:hypothetical protein
MLRLFFLLITTSPFLIFAQEIQKPKVYQQGNHHLQLGIGYPNLASVAINGLAAVGQYTSTSPSNQGKSFPRINVNYDYALDQNLSLGAYIGFSSATTPAYNWDIPEIDFRPVYYYEGGSGVYQYKVNSFLFGFRGLRHFELSEIIDFYARGSVGFSINKIKTIGDEAPTDVSGISYPTIPVPNISIGGHFGMRYLFTENIGAYGEVGYSTSDVIQLGVSYRILKKDKPTED